MKDYVAEAGITQEDILKVLRKVMNEDSFEEKQAKRTARRRRAKADFCNLNANTIKDVVFF